MFANKKYQSAVAMFCEFIFFPYKKVKLIKYYARAVIRIFLED